MGVVGVDSSESILPVIVCNWPFRVSNLLMKVINCCFIDCILICMRSIDVVSSEVAFDVLDVFEPFVELLPTVVLDCLLDAAEESDTVGFLRLSPSVPMVELSADPFVFSEDVVDVLRTRGAGARNVGTESDSPG